MDEAGADRHDPEAPLVIGKIPEDWPRDDLRSLFTQTPDATWVIDLNGGRVYANAATARLFHVDPDSPAVLGKDGMFMLHPTEWTRTLDELRELISGERELVSRTKVYLRPDGTEFHGRLEARPLRDGSGRSWAVLSTCRDVTRQQQAERALIQREAWFEALVRHNVDTIIVLDKDATLTYASPGADELVGEPASAWTGRNALDLVHPGDLDVVAEAFGNTASTPGTAVPLRFRMVRADGGIRMVEAVATNLLDDPAVRGVVVNVRDLTEREEVTTALEVSENRFRKMLENISDTVTLIDSGGQVIRTTGNVKSILGYPTEFWTVRNAFDIAHPDDLDLIRQMFVRLLETPGGEASGEFRVRNAEGNYEDIEANAINLLDDEEVGTIVVTTRNISARKVAERELAEARDQALRALEVRNEFVASVSHELRTPIHGILGLAELLATSSDTDEEVVQLALSIRRATESLRLVLDDILDFTKIEAGRLELNEHLVALRELIDDIDVLFGPQAAAKGVSLHVTADDSLPAAIVSDGLRLRQVLNNLVSNAVKFTSEGRVDVVFGRAGDTKGDILRVEVTDTGIGMVPEVLKRVFEPFSQGHAATAREYGGTGLGLTIARRLVDLMDGMLSVESTPGEGTSFVIELPLRTRAPEIPGASEEPARDRRGLEPRRVLVVEDNTVNQLLVGRQLERLGYEPLIVESGEAAIERFSRDDGIDAVLLDWQMQGIDGLDTARELRRFEAGEHRSRVPMIAMTASALAGDRDRCLAAGMDDFVAKPVNLATLGRMLATWLFPAEDAISVDDHEASREERGSSAVDSGVLDRLLDELDDPSLVGSVIATYRRELPSRVENLEDAARAGDMSEVFALAHTLKSTSAALGAENLAELCRQLEHLAKTDSAGARSIEPLLAMVGAERTRVDEALRAEAERFMLR